MLSELNKFDLTKEKMLWLLIMKRFFLQCWNYFVYVYLMSLMLYQCWICQNSTAAYHFIKIMPNKTTVTQLISMDSTLSIFVTTCQLSKVFS